MKKIKCCVSSFKIISKFLLQTLPRLCRVYGRIRKIVKNDCCRNPFRREDFSAQMLLPALFSIHPGGCTDRALEFMAAFSILCAYVNKLCRESPCREEKVYRQLNSAVSDAVEPSRPLADYCRYYGNSCDTLMLNTLVKHCRSLHGYFPSLPLFLSVLKSRISLYCDVNSYRYLHMDESVNALKTWAGYYLHSVPGLYWWEFAACAGSLAGSISLLAVSALEEQDTTGMEPVSSLYFPWICSIQQLLEEYIHPYSLRKNDNLRLSELYDNMGMFEKRIIYMYNEYIRLCSTLNTGIIHIATANMMICLYLSGRSHSFGMEKLADRNILRHILLQCPVPAGHIIRTAAVLPIRNTIC